MIKSITVRTYLNDEITLELARPELSGFIVKSVDGLGPAKANINVTDISTNDGGIFNSSRLDKRNIVIELGFLEGRTYLLNGKNHYETIEDVRQNTYKYFPIKKKVHLTVVTDNHTLGIDGYVESNEPDIFSQNEGCSISIICPDPFFYSEENYETSFNSVEAAFEFPFSNDSTTDSLLLMGIMGNNTEKVIVYEGTSDIGMTMEFYALGEVTTNITITNTTTKETMRIDADKLKTLMDAEKAIIAGDTIIINTTKGDKSITLIRDGVATNILNCVDRDSKWFTLQKGDNIFSYAVDPGSEVTNLQCYVMNKVAYDGV